MYPWNHSMIVKYRDTELLSNTRYVIEKKQTNKIKCLARFMDVYSCSYLRKRCSHQKTEDFLLQQISNHNSRFLFIQIINTIIVQRLFCFFPFFYFFFCFFLRMFISLSIIVLVPG